MHERGTRRKLLPSPATIITAQQAISQDRGRDLVTANNRGGIVSHDFTSELNIHELQRGCFHQRDLEAKRTNSTVVSGLVSTAPITSTVTRLPGRWPVALLGRIVRAARLRRSSRAAQSASLAQHHLRRVLQFGNDQESLRRRTHRGSGAASESL